MSIFQDINLYPSHGDQRVIVTWGGGPQYGDHQVSVAASVTGTPDSWVVLPAVAEFGQRLMVITNWNPELHQFFRFLVTKPGTTDMRSPVVGIYQDVTRREYGLAKTIIAREFEDMRRANGIPAWFCAPIISGELASSVDPDTGMMVKATACDDGMGMRYAGGFYKPVITWVRLFGPAQTSDRKDDPDGDGQTSSEVQNIRMMPFPPPRAGVMLVCPKTDRRWVLGPDSKILRLREILPVIYESTATLLRPNDPRHKFEVPEFTIEDRRRIKPWTLSGYHDTLPQ